MGKKGRGDGSMLLAVVLAVSVVLCAAYICYNYLYLPHKTEKDNARYAAMYEREAAESPDFTAVPQATAGPEISPAPEVTSMPYEELPEDIRLGTPDADTMVILAATPPPVQESFGELIRANPETAGFLRTNDGLALPVVQKVGDNEHYLEYDFEGNKNNAGCLFVDGMNRLYPRDECIYIYGHNMKNGTMFGNLDDMATVGGLINASPVYFDSIYENGIYVPFACLQLTADQTSDDYFEIRHFDLDPESYADFVADLKKRSILDIPIDAVYGDDMLILITCNYSINDGRFAVAFRRLRDGETVESAMRLVEMSTVK